MSWCCQRLSAFLFLFCRSEAYSGKRRAPLAGLDVSAIGGVGLLATGTEATSCTELGDISEIPALDYASSGYFIKDDSKNAEKVNAGEASPGNGLYCPLVDGCMTIPRKIHVPFAGEFMPEGHANDALKIPIGGMTLGKGLLCETISYHNLSKPNNSQCLDSAVQLGGTEVSCAQALVNNPEFCSNESALAIRFCPRTCGKCKEHHFGIACEAPVGIVNATLVPCKEGAMIPGSTWCTPSCKNGTHPVVDITRSGTNWACFGKAATKGYWGAKLCCAGGSLTPPTFQCVENPFQYFDTDDSGTITREEMVSGMSGNASTNLESQISQERHKLLRKELQKAEDSDEEVSMSGESVTSAESDEDVNPVVFAFVIISSVILMLVAVGLTYHVIVNLDQAQPTLDPPVAVDLPLDFDELPLEQDLISRLLLVSDLADGSDLLTKSAWEWVVVIRVPYEGTSLADLQAAIQESAGEPKKQYASVGIVDKGQLAELDLLQQIGAVPLSDMLEHEQLKPIFEFLASYVTDAPAGSAPNSTECRIDFLSCSAVAGWANKDNPNADGTSFASCNRVKCCANLDEISSANFATWDLKRDELNSVHSWYFDEASLDPWRESPLSTTLLPLAMRHALRWYSKKVHSQMLQSEKAGLLPMGCGALLGSVTSMMFKSLPKDAKAKAVFHPSCPDRLGDKGARCQELYSFVSDSGSAEELEALARWKDGAPTPAVLIALKSGLESPTQTKTEAQEEMSAQPGQPTLESLETQG